MYWAAQSHHAVEESLESLYAKGIDGLGEILDSDNVILKTRNGDEKLLNYLAQELIIKRLVEYIVGIGLVGEAALRYPLIACELLCSGQSVIFDRLKDDPLIMAPLWRLPMRMTPPFLVCWSRFSHFLIARMPEKVCESLVKDEDSVFIQTVINQLNFTEVCEVLLKLLAIEGLVDWFIDNCLVKKVFEKMLQEEGFQLSCQTFVVGLLSFPFPETYKRSFEKIISMLIDELEKLLIKVFVEEPEKEIFITTCEITLLLIKKLILLDDQSGLIDKLSTILVQRLESLKNIIISTKASGIIISSPPQCAKDETFRPVGQIRLEAIKLFADLTGLEHVNIVKEIYRLNLANVLIDMFFAYPQNNFLHGAVSDFICNILGGDLTIHKDLIISLFKDCKLTEKIVKNQLRNDSIMQQARRNRLGNMGHATIIVDEIIKLLDNLEAGDGLGKEVQEFINDDEDWKTYIEVAHRETKIKNALVLGGTKAPLPPSPVEEEFTNSFTGIYTSGTDEQLARYFCQQVIANLPNRFILADPDEEDESSEDPTDQYQYQNGYKPYSDDDDDYNDDDDATYDAIQSIEIPMEPNGFDALLEMEMRLSALGDFPSGDSNDEEEGNSEALLAGKKGSSLIIDNDGNNDYDINAISDGDEKDKDIEPNLK